MRTHEKPTVISAKLVMRVRQATGLGVMDTKRFLEKVSPEYYSRFMEAIYSQTQEQYNFSESYIGHKLLYDPIEDKLDVKPIIEKANLETEELLRNKPRGRGFGHLFEYTKKRILREKYNVEWFTLAEMNPSVIFD